MVVGTLSLLVVTNNSDHPSPHGLYMQFQRPNLNRIGRWWSGMSHRPADILSHSNRLRNEGPISTCGIGANHLVFAALEGWSSTLSLRSFFSFGLSGRNTLFTHILEPPYSL